MPNDNREVLVPDQSTYQVGQPVFLFYRSEEGTSVCPAVVQKKNSTDMWSNGKVVQRTSYSFKILSGDLKRPVEDVKELSSLKDAKIFGSLEEVRSYWFAEASKKLDAKLSKVNEMSDSFFKRNGIYVDNTSTDIVVSDPAKRAEDRFYTDAIDVLPVEKRSRVDEEDDADDNNEPANNSSDNDAIDEYENESPPQPVVTKTRKKSSVVTRPPANYNRRPGLSDFIRPTPANVISPELDMPESRDDNVVTPVGKSNNQEKEVF